MITDSSQSAASSHVPRGVPTAGLIAPRQTGALNNKDLQDIATELEHRYNKAIPAASKLAHLHKITMCTHRVTNLQSLDLGEAGTGVDRVDECISS